MSCDCHTDPAEIQTYALRGKGLLVWNTLSQLMGAYVTWVDAIALNAIGYKYYIVGGTFQSCINDKSGS
jgi:hypothetical protein